MKTYLDKKGIKFKDERLNKAINVVALAKGGKEKMDFLFSYLTSEAIEAINAKRYIICIPLKKGCLMESILDDVSDPSYNTTMQVLSILDGNNKFYQFSFNLSYFHSKSMKSNSICTYDTGTFEIDENGIVISKRRKEDKSMFFNISNERENNDGIQTLVGGPSSKSKKDYNVKYDMKSLIEFITSDLKTRNYYQRLDRETYRLYYPAKYEYYDTEEQHKLAEVIEKVTSLHDLIHDMNYKKDSLDDNYHMRFNLLLKEVNEINYSKFDKFISCDDYLKKHNLEKFPYIDYDEWVNDKGSVVKVEEDDIPLFDEKEEKQEAIYEFYNPNKIRYEDDEEEEIGNRRR